MNLESQIEIAASQRRIWRCLHDPALLQKCITGCNRLEWAVPYEDVLTGPESKKLNAQFKTDIGPVEIALKGTLILKRQIGIDSYILQGQGSGLLAGKARGEAEVYLQPLDDVRTNLRVLVGGAVSGLLSRVGSRLVKGAALKQLNMFLQKLKTQIEAHPPPAQ